MPTLAAMRRFLPILLLLPVLGLASEPLPDLVTTPVRSGAKNPNDSAVVIGIEDYAFVQDVPYAARDAEAFQSFLVYTRGVPQARVQSLVSVTGSNRASREKILEALAEAGQETPAGGTVWIFFSGHGVADPSDPQKRLILGQDVMGDEGSFMARGVSLDEMRSLAGAGGAEVVMVLDACYGGAGRSGEALLPGTHFVVPEYNLARSSRGIEWDAAGPNELSRPFDAASQGAFSYFATGALRGWADGEVDEQRDGQVTAEEAQTYVGRMLKVAGIRSQVPVLGGSFGKVLAKGKLEVGPTDEQVARAVGSVGAQGGGSQYGGTDLVALAAAEAKARQAAEALRQATEAEYATQAAAVQGAAKKDWGAIGPLLAVKDASAKRVADAFVAKYGAATASVGGVSRAVSIPEVATAQAWLGSYQEADTVKVPTARIGVPRAVPGILRSDTGGAATAPVGFRPRSIPRVPGSDTGAADRSNPAGLTWVSIPAGSFSMGSSVNSNEQPLHTVTVSAFRMSRTEVTFGQYEACVDAGACSPAHTDDGTCLNWTGSEWQWINLPSSFLGATQPVVCVDWDQATAFARWAGGRLPTEAEWEYAAKAGQNTTYAGSENLAEVAWTEENSGAVTHPVGQKKANAWGLYDMTGNVWEWTQDWCHDSYSGAPANGSAWESPAGSFRVLRGGSWSYSSVGARVASRGGNYSASSFDDRGFRVSRSIEP